MLAFDIIGAKLHQKCLINKENTVVFPTTPANWPYKTSAKTRIYAIGDIHGHLKTLKAMHLAIDNDMQNGDFDHVVILYIGDYIDRGPANAEVVEYLLRMSTEQVEGLTRIFLKGNHENGLLDFMEAPLQRRDYLVYGGRETLQTYGIPDIPKVEMLLPADYERYAEQAKNLVPQAHIEFMKNLSMMWQNGDYVFAHAGVNPLKPLNQQSDWDLMMIRPGFLDYTGPALPYCVVHGHTIFEKPEIHHYRIAIDTGLYQHGKLTCVVLEDENVRFLQVKNADY